MISRIDMDDMSETGHITRQAAALDDPSIVRASPSQALAVVAGVLQADHDSGAAGLAESVEEARRQIDKALGTEGRA